MKKKTVGKQRGRQRNREAGRQRQGSRREAVDRRGKKIKGQKRK